FRNRISRQPLPLLFPYTTLFRSMNRLRGEHKNFYTVPFAERQRQMEQHGLVGRRYAGRVQQIITGSIGFDDWEWGVDLFGDDPLDRKSTRLNSSHLGISYAVFCL